MRRLVRMSADKPFLVTYPNVELLAVGEDWITSTGVFTFTPEDLESAIAAEFAPELPGPVLKFGHTDHRFMGDGEFSVGRVKNLRMSANGMTLIGDFVGVPRWLADVLPYAYPRRSIEGDWVGMSRRNQPTWEGFHLTAMALLGAFYPACARLEDLEAFWTNGDPPMYDSETGDIMPLSVAMEAMVEEGTSVALAGETRKALVRAAGGRSNRPLVNATAAVADVMRSWYDDETPETAQFDSWWSWVCEIYVDPYELIVEDDNGDLWRQPYTITGDVIAFQTATKVKRTYVDATRVAAGSRGGQEAIAVWAAREDNPHAPQGDPPRGTVSATGDQPVVEEDPNDMKLTDAQITALGLDPATNPDEAAIQAAMDTKLGIVAPTTEVPAPVVTEPVVAPVADVAPVPVAAGAPGTVVVDAAGYAEMQAFMAQQRTQSANDAKLRRDGAVAAAVKAGKFPPSMAASYRNMLDVNEEEATKTIASLATGVVPVEMRGVEPSGDGAANTSDYPDSWKRQPAMAGVAAGAAPIVPPVAAATQVDAATGFRTTQA